MHTLLHSGPPTLQQAMADPCLCQRLLDEQGWVSLLQDHCSFLLGPGAHKVLFEPSKRLCKFWWLYHGVNGDLFPEGLCHTQVYCTQSPCPCSSPLLTHTSSGDTQTQFYLSLCGVAAYFLCLETASLPAYYPLSLKSTFSCPMNINRRPVVSV